MFKTRLSSAALLAALLSSPLMAQSTTRATLDSFGNEADGSTWESEITPDGRWIVYTSYASNLVSGDTNSAPDVFLHDRTSGETIRVSVDADGNQADLGGDQADVSADGTLVVFASAATNLVAVDDNSAGDIFVKNLVTGEVELISLDASGGPADGWSSLPALSGDGRYVAFQSEATDLIAGDANGITDIFVHDRQTGTTERVSEDALGVGGNAYSGEPSISHDGRFVAYKSSATNLVDGDTNGYMDVFLHDRVLETTTLISIGMGGIQADSLSYEAKISGDGSRVLFNSYATNLASGAGTGESVYLYDSIRGYAEVVSVDSCGVPADILAEAGGISANGRYVAFFARASNWANGRGDPGHNFVRDLELGTTVRVSQHSDGTPADSYPYAHMGVSDQGVATFSNQAANLVDQDLNGQTDVFVHEARTGIYLDTSNAAPNLGESLTLTAGGGGPGSPGILYISSVNGAPVAGGLLSFSYGADGTWSATAALNNPLASGLRLGLTTFGLLCNGKLVSSEETYLDIQ